MGRDGRWIFAEREIKLHSTFSWFMFAVIQVKSTRLSRFNKRQKKNNWVIENNLFRENNGGIHSGR